MSISGSGTDVHLALRNTRWAIRDWFYAKGTGGVRGHGQSFVVRMGRLGWFLRE